MERRYDIDWLRVIAIALLLIYHVTISFQPWGIVFLFIQSQESIESLWYPMALINIWRIPILFFISGMGVYFAMQKRDWKALFLERAKRIAIPLIFGIFFIVPLHIFLLQAYYHKPLSFAPNTGHLWFLLNIIIYISLLYPVFYYISKNPEIKLVKGFQKLLRSWPAIYLLLLPFVLEVVLIRPDTFSMFLFSAHGYVLGLICFFLGFYFVSLGEIFWNALRKSMPLNFILALSLYLIRLMVYELKAPLPLTAMESMFWIFFMFGLCYKFLNRSGKTIRYLAPAAYPVYIVHMAFQYLACYAIFPLQIPILAKYGLVILFTFMGSLLLYEFAIRRIKWIRPLFGLKLKG